MIFSRKKKEEDVEEIKNLVMSKKAPEAPDEFVLTPTEERIPEILESIGGNVTEETIQKKPNPAQEVKKIEVQKREIPMTIEEKKPVFAPLYVKIDKYRSLLSTINDLKTTVIMIKNSLGLQKEIEGLRDENRRLMETAISKIDKKIVMLDSEFLRPQGFEEDFPPQIYESEGLEGVVTDLKKQIDGLKSELQTIS